MDNPQTVIAVPLEEIAYRTQHYLCDREFGVMDGDFASLVFHFALRAMQARKSNDLVLCTLRIDRSSGSESFIYDRRDVVLREAPVGNVHVTFCVTISPQTVAMLNEACEILHFSDIPSLYRAALFGLREAVIDVRDGKQLCLARVELSGTPDNPCEIITSVELIDLQLQRMA